MSIPRAAISVATKAVSFPALKSARALVQQLVAQQQTQGPAWLLNVNIPSKPLDQIKPLRVTRLGRRHAAERVITQTSPRGDTMYWIGPAGDAREAGEGTDFHATAQGAVSITPLQVDLTDHAGLAGWAGWQSRVAKAS